jgi:hypothetical protein
LESSLSEKQQALRPASHSELPGPLRFLCVATEEINRESDPSRIRGALTTSIMVWRGVERSSGGFDRYLGTRAGQATWSG